MAGPGNDQKPPHQQVSQRTGGSPCLPPCRTVSASLASYVTPTLAHCKHTYHVSKPEGYAYAAVRRKNLKG
jgi:hypothetical protein